MAGTVHRASWRSCGARGRYWAAAGFRVAGAAHTPSWLPFAWQEQHTASWRSCGARGRRWAAAGFAWQAQYFLAAFRVASAVHRASWRSCGARGRRWAAAGFRVAGAVHRASWLPFAWSRQSLLEDLRRPLGRGWLSCGRCSTGCLSRAQYTEPSAGGVASTQSLLEELRRAWAPLGRGWLSCGRRSTQSFLGLSRGRRSTQSLVEELWHAQYTEPSGGAAARVGAAGPRLASCSRRSTESFLAGFCVAGAVLRAFWPRLAFVWQAQYLLRRRRPHSSFTTLHYTTYHRSLIIHHSSLHHLSHLTHHSPLFTTLLTTSHSPFTTLHYSVLIIHHSSLHHLSHLTHHSPLFTTLLITSHSSFITLHYTTYHISAIVFDLDPAAPVPASAVVDLSSPLITAPLITSQLLITTYHIQLITDPLLTPHLSHQNSSQLHFSHLT